MKWYTLKQKNNISNRFWDFGLTYCEEIQYITVNNSRYANGRIPIEIITGENSDINEYLDFKFYNWVSF